MTPRVNSFGSRIRRSIGSRNSIGACFYVGVRGSWRLRPASCRPPRARRVRRAVRRYRAGRGVRASSRRPRATCDRAPAGARGSTFARGTKRETGENAPAGELRHRPTTAEGGHHSQRVVAERLGRPAAQHGDQIVGQERTFANGVLGRHRIDAAFAVRNRGAIAQGPNARNRRTRISGAGRSPHRVSCSASRASRSSATARRRRSR